MPLVITQGYGDPGGGALAEVVVTQGYGGIGVNPTCHVFDLMALNVFQNRLDLVFSVPISLTVFALNIANWAILNVGGGSPMSITAVSVTGAVVSLTVTEGTAGAQYQLNIPTVGINDFFTNPYPGPYTQLFYAVATGPVISLAFAPNGIHVRVIFNEPVLMSEAVIAANYVITGGGGLTVLSAVQESANSILLETSLQTPGQSYLLTVSNIHDLHGNLI